MTKDRLKEMQVIYMGSHHENDEDERPRKDEEASLLNQDNFEEVENFLTRVTEYQDEINVLEENYLGRIHSIHEKLLEAPGADSSMTGEVNELMSTLQARSTTLRAGIKSMEAEVKKLEHSPNMTDTQTATARIKRDQVMCLVKKLQTLIVRVQTEQSDYKERSKVKVANSLRVRGFELNDEEIEDAIENGDITQKTVGLMLGLKDRQALFEEVKTRHDELLTLEKSMRELAEMFSDLSNLVQSQGEMMNRIETNVANAVDYADKARTNVEEAKKLQASTRKKKIILMIFLIILFVILVIFIQGLVCHFTPFC